MGRRCFRCRQLCNCRYHVFADIGDFDGLLVNASPGVNFQAYEHFGIGLNYNYFELDVSVDKSNWRGDIETTYDGIYVYASVYY